MKKLITLALVLLLAGCANLRFQWAASYATDNVLADLERANKPVESAK
ncbi:hypothetical protein ACFQUU_08840 [Herbaspirillum sp. GCM10030257]